MSLETSLAEAEGVGLTLPGGKLVDSLRCFPARHSLGVARTRLEDHFPEPLVPVAALLLGQDGEVAQGEVTVDALVDAPELVGSFSPLATGIGRGRSAQAALQVIQCARPVLPLDGDRTQVEEHERVVGPLGQLGLEDPAIALKLPFPQRRVGLARVPDRDLGPPHRDIHPPQGRQDLLVDRVRQAHVLPHRIPDSFSVPFNDRKITALNQGLTMVFQECAGATSLNRPSTAPPPPAIQWRPVLRPLMIYSCGMRSRTPSVPLA